MQKVEDILKDTHEHCLRSKTLAAVEMALYVAEAQGPTYLIEVFKKVLERFQTAAKEELVDHWRRAVAKAPTSFAKKTTLIALDNLARTCRQNTH